MGTKQEDLFDAALNHILETHNLDYERLWQKLTRTSEQLSAEQASSITRTVSASKNLISQSIGRIIPVVECYRVKGNKDKEVLVRIAYNSQMAMEAAKKVVKQELEKKGEDLHEQLDKIMGF